MPQVRGRRSIVVAAALLVATLAGCGVTKGDGGGQALPQVVEAGEFQGANAAAALGRAAEATGSVDTMRMTMEITMPAFAGEEGVTITSEGAFDTANQRGRMTMDLGDVPGGSMIGGDGGMETIVDGDVVYLKSSVFGMFSGGKTWVKIDASDFGDVAGGLSGGATGNPSSILEMLEGAGGKVTTVGTEDVRGVSTTHLKADLDLGKVLDQADEQTELDLREQFDGLGTSLDAFDALPVEVWVDDAGYVRRFVMTFDLGAVPGAPEGEDGLVMTQSIEMYDFNEPVDIELPDPADVGELDPSALAGD